MDPNGGPVGPGGPPDEVPDYDEALERLEDFILAYPSDRALPDIATIVREAGVTEDFLRADERAHKVLLEAISARPLSSLDHITQVRTEVELLTLEVEVLTDRLATAADGYRRREAADRLDEVRRRLDEIQREL